MSSELKSGDDLSMTEFARRREDVKWLIASGGHLYLTVSGRRRMKLTPVPPEEMHGSADRVEQGNEAPAPESDVPTSVDAGQTSAG